MRQNSGMGDAEQGGNRRWATMKNAPFNDEKIPEITPRKTGAKSGKTSVDVQVLLSWFFESADPAEVGVELKRVKG